MKLSRLFYLVCLAAACLLDVSPSASAAKPAAPTARPTASAPASSAVPSLPLNASNAMPSPSPSPGCDKEMKVGEVTLCSNEFNFNFKSGDVQFPQPLHGRTSDGTYRADRGYGNLHSEIMNLIGHVVVHRDASRDKNGKPVEAMTLTADQAHIESKAKFYRASGNVKIVQGNLTLTAPLIIDDEAHRTINASGGVKIVKGDKTLTAPQIALDETTHVANLTGGVHAEQKPDRSFDSAQVLYNTATEDFKAVGGVRMQFPASQAAPPPAARGASPRPSATPASKTTASPSPGPTRSPAPRK